MNKITFSNRKKRVIIQSSNLDILRQQATAEKLIFPNESHHGMNLNSLIAERDQSLSSPIRSGRIWENPIMEDDYIDPDPINTHNIMVTTDSESIPFNKGIISFSLLITSIFVDPGNKGNDLDNAEEPVSARNHRWNERYMELKQYKLEHGHCMIPYHNPGPILKVLAEWVKRQRHQYRLKKSGIHSTMTDERERLLNELGFCWDSRAQFWDERFQELVNYKTIFGHCRMNNDPQYLGLKAWLKRQRHFCRLYQAGDRKVGITPERVSKLIELGIRIGFNKNS